MLKSLEINNFRCFEKFELPQLSRVNLFVGKNNSGKSSILEAIHILDSRDPNSFWDATRRRMENGRKMNSAKTLDHFCRNHDLNDLKKLSIFGKTDGENALFDFHIEDLNNPVFRWKNIGGEPEQSINMPLKVANQEGILSMLRKRKIFFVSIEPSVSMNIIDLFNEVVITPQEEILYEALRFIEPGIIRIAPVKDLNFMVLLDNQRVPIGSMGDGIQRMLAITLAMVNVPGGILLIDEIDTGLHFSVMVDLWRLICQTAEKLDIQVFATTHSSDCWKSLAEVAQSKEFPNSDVTIHRIEKDKKASVMFNEKEMAIAAQRDIEVR